MKLFMNKDILIILPYRSKMWSFWIQNTQICFSHALSSIQNYFQLLRASICPSLSPKTFSSFQRSKLKVKYLKTVFLKGEFDLRLLSFDLFDDGLEDIVGTVERPENLCAKHSSKGRLVGIRWFSHLYLKLNIMIKTNKIPLIRFRNIILHIRHNARICNFSAGFVCSKYQTVLWNRRYLLILQRSSSYLARICYSRSWNQLLRM